MISDIKNKGFDKFKKEIDDRESLKKNLEISVENLQKRLNFIKSQGKNYGTKNTKYEDEINQYKQCSEVVNIIYIIHIETKKRFIFYA
jgi:hypothetical protein